MDPEAQLSWEARLRPRAAMAAVAAGVLTIGGGVLAATVYRDFPSLGLLEALRSLSAGEPARIKAEQVAFYEENAGSLLAVSAVLSFGALALAGALAFLYRATKARRPELPRLVWFAGVGGPVALALSQFLQQVIVTVDAGNFATARDRSEAAAQRVVESDLVIAAAVIRQAAVLALGFALVLLALNAMRAGLLTRFMGVLGIFVGVLFVIPIGSPLPIVQSFWLVALGVLFAGRWPSGVPPAWRTGRAEPWPSPADLREARERERESGEGAAEPAREDAGERSPAPSGGAGAPDAVPRKRKRKRRR